MPDDMPDDLEQTDATAPEPGAPELSVVVCCYTLRRWDDVVAAVTSLQLQRPAPTDIVLVVDHNEELLRRCRERWPQGVTIVASDGPSGLSGARNTGLRVAGAEIVAFLDDDAAAQPGWSTALLDAYRDGDDVLGVGGYIEPSWAAGARPSWWPPAFDWVVGCSYEGLPRERTDVRNVIGANMSVRRAPALAAGGFHTAMGRIGQTPLGGEETELYIRLRRAHPGARVVYEPAARVVHRVGPERATWRYFQARCWGEGLTKAALARLADPASALASERVYVTTVLPRQALAGLLSRDPRRGAAVALGLAVTGLGYVRGRLRRRG